MNWPVVAVRTAVIAEKMAVVETSTVVRRGICSALTGGAVNPIIETAAIIAAATTVPTNVIEDSANPKFCGRPRLTKQNTTPIPEATPLNLDRRLLMAIPPSMTAITVRTDTVR